LVDRTRSVQSDAPVQQGGVREYFAKIALRENTQILISLVKMLSIIENNQMDGQNTEN
jgi:hypothetical protein